MIPNIAASVCSDSSGTDLALHTWSALDWCHSAQVGAAFGNSKFALVGKIRDTGQRVWLILTICFLMPFLPQGLHTLRYSPQSGQQ
jgi:hypothetical protein